MPYAPAAFGHGDRLGILRVQGMVQGALENTCWAAYCTGQAIPTKKKTFYRQVLKLGANEASAQGLQNAL